MDAAIDVRNLAKTYPGEGRAVREIGFDVAPGEVFGLLGPNGAGKSTTIGMLTTTIVPTLRQRPARRCRRRRRAARRARGQQRRVPGCGRRPVAHRSPQPRDPRPPLGGRRRGATRRIDELGDAFGIGEIARPAGRRPTAAASAAGSRSPGRSCREPRVLFLDEPTVGLDPRIRYELLDVIAGLRDRAEMTILLTTHYLDEAERLCDRIAIMHAGAIVALDTPAALLAGLGSEIVELRVDGDVAAALASLRAHGVAGDDAFAVGATAHRPAARADRRRDAIAAIGAARPRRRRQDPAARRSTTSTCS